MREHQSNNTPPDEGTGTLPPYNHELVVTSAGHIYVTDGIGNFRLLPEYGNGYPVREILALQADTCPYLI